MGKICEEQKKMFLKLRTAENYNRMDSAVLRKRLKEMIV